MNNQAPKMPASSANIGRYAGIVRDKAVKRELIEFGRDVADGATTSPEKSKAMLDRASPRLEQLSEARMRAERNQA